MIPQESITPIQTYQPVGTFNGNTFKQDDETGLIFSDGSFESNHLRNGNASSPLSTFTLYRKLQVLNHLYDCYPNISKACAKVGLSRQTFTNHMSVDKVLRECVEEIKNKKIDKIHEVRMSVAEKDSGSFDRMCVLNAHMPELYNPKIKVEIEHSLNPSQARERDANIANVIDAEVVETVRRARKIKENGLR